MRRWIRLFIVFVAKGNNIKSRVSILVGIVLAAQASIGVAAAGGCSAGQLDSKYGFLQISPVFSIDPAIGGPNGSYEGIVSDANGNAFTVAPASIDSDGDSIGAIVKAGAIGSRDLSFGGFGAVVPAGQPLSAYLALAMDGAGNLLVASGGTIGLFNPTPADVIIVNRHSASGVADTTYGDGVSGVATIPLDNMMPPIDLRAGSGGSVIIAASANDPSSVSGKRVPVAVKLTPSGVLDSSFGTGGISYFYTPTLASTFGPTGKATDVTILSNGKLLIAGRVGDNSTYNKFFVARLQANGMLDPTFGIGGMTVVSFGSIGTSSAIAYGRKMALQSDGKIVVAGGLAQTAPGPSTGTGILRLTSTGQLDTTFNGTGKLTLPPGSGGILVTHVALQDNDKILLAGLQFLDVAQTMVVAAVARLTSTGQLDTTFGVGGIGTIASPLGGGSSINRVNFVPASPSGHIVVNLSANDGVAKTANYLAQLDSGSPARCH
jgi:uncharacterized delta-60 repeat protein